MPPLTDIMFDVDELGAWAGSAGGGAGRIPASAAAIGYGQSLLARPVPPGTPYAMAVTTVAASGGSAEPFTLTAATVDTNVHGYLNQSPFITGNISPVVFNGETIGAMYADNTGHPVFGGFYVAFFGALVADFFESVTLNGTTLLSSVAVFSSNAAPIAAPNSQWFWNGSVPITANGSYTGEFNFT